MKSQHGGHDGHVTVAIAALVDDVAKLDTVESWQDLRVDVADLLSQLGASNTLGQHTGWRRGVVVSGVRRMNEVNARRARLVLGWVIVFGRVYHLGMKQAN